jgi:hypothetical protein
MSPRLNVLVGALHQKMKALMPPAFDMSALILFSAAAVSSWPVY